MSMGQAPPGYRLPAETRVGAVRLHVTDLERSVDFYSRVLGLQRIEVRADGARLGAGGVALVELRGGAQRAHPGRRLGLYHFAILLPDRPALGRCLAHLITNGIRPGASDHLVSEALYLRDPDGLGIEVYRDRPREEWRTRGDELAMASDPLDFEGVLDAGAAQPWSAAPEGTRIGHVHLHVGDLDAASDFYHAGLGFDVVVSSYPGALFLAAGDYHHHLGVNTWAGPAAEPSDTNEARLLSWELQLPSTQAIESGVTSLARRNYTVEKEGDGALSATDPWRTKVRLILAE